MAPIEKDFPLLSIDVEIFTTKTIDKNIATVIFMLGIKIILNVCYKYTHRKALVISGGGSKGVKISNN